MKVAIIQYSTYGHITTLAKAVQEGVVQSGLATEVDLFQVPETLSDEVLQLLHAPDKPADIPVADLATFEGYDAFLFGIPTRFGNLPAQWVELWGQTGGLWAKGALHGKPAGVFVSGGTPGGGQEVTVRHSLSYLAHQGLIYVPLGYKAVFGDLTNLEEVHGGSPWGAGTFAGTDGSRQPTDLEKKIARIQGEEFAKSAIKFVKSAPVESNEKSATPASQSSSDNSKKASPTKETTQETRNNQSTKVTSPDEKSGCKCIIM